MTAKTEAERLADDWQHLKPFGYAPGGYMMKCRGCAQTAHDVDKRAIRCRPCAEAAYTSRSKTPDEIRQFAQDHAPKLAAEITRLCGSVIAKGMQGILEEVCRIQAERDRLQSEVERLTAALAAERERCARVCEEHAANTSPPFKAHEDTYMDGWLDACNEIGWAIRAEAKGE